MSDSSLETKLDSSKHVAGKLDSKGTEIITLENSADHIITWLAK